MSRSRYLALIIALAFAYFFPNIRAGGVLLPLDVLHHLGPFSDSVPKELETVRNFHLTDLVTMIYPCLIGWQHGLRILAANYSPELPCGSRSFVFVALIDKVRSLPVSVRLALIGLAQIEVRKRAVKVWSSSFSLPQAA